MICRVATHAGHRDADVDRRAHARLEQVVDQVDLAIGDRDDVGRDVRRDVAALGLDDRQCGQRAGATLVVQLRGALEQAAVQVEDVTGVRLASRRTAQQQRQLPIGLGLLRQVVVHDERVLAVLHPVLTHRATRVGSEVLEWRRVGGGRNHDDRVVHGTAGGERRDGLRHGRALLPDRDVDALHPLALLVQDRVDRDRRLAGLAVADDQLALTAADRRHRVDGLDAGLHRLVHGLAAHDRGAWISRRRSIGSTSGPRPSIGSPSALTTRPRRPSPTGTERMRPVALTVWPSSTSSAAPEHDRADRLLVEVEREAERAVLELEQLVHARPRQPGDICDAVADLGHAAHRLGLDRGVEAFEVLAQRGDDVVGVDRELCHGVLFSSLQQRLQLAEAVAHGAVDDRVAH